MKSDSLLGITLMSLLVLAAAPESQAQVLYNPASVATGSISNDLVRDVVDPYVRIRGASQNGSYVDGYGGLLLDRSSAASDASRQFYLSSRHGLRVNLAEMKPPGYDAGALGNLNSRAGLTPDSVMAGSSKYMYLYSGLRAMEEFGTRPGRAAKARYGYLAAYQAQEEGGGTGAAVPEPPAWMLLALGLLGIGWARRRTS